MVALTRVIGRKPAFAMLVTGDFIEAREAARLGLINVAVAEEDLETETRALAERITSKLGPVVRLGKRTFYEQAEIDVEAAYAHAGAVMAENMMRDDTAEGVNAFVEKRAPDWKR